MIEYGYMLTFYFYIEAKLLSLIKQNQRPQRSLSKKLKFNTVAIGTSSVTVTRQTHLPQQRYVPWLDISCLSLSHTHLSSYIQIHAYTGWLKKYFSDICTSSSRSVQPIEMRFYIYIYSEV